MPITCEGVNHIDYSIDGRYFLATCEFSGELLKVDVAEQKVLGKLKLTPVGMPQDCKLSPDGKVFYVANMEANGVHLIDGDSLKQIAFLPTGKGTHGLYVSRDSKYLYVSNRGEGTVSLIELRHAQGGHQVGHSRRRQPRHGRRLGGRQGSLALRPLSQRGLRVRHLQRQPDRQDSGRQESPRSLRLSAARSLFARPHRRLPLARIWNRNPGYEDPIEGVHPLVAPLFFSFAQVREDLRKHTEGLSQQEVWQTAGPNPSLGFQLRHMAGSVDRLATYLTGGDLSKEQLDALRAEPLPGATLGDLLTAMDQTFTRVEEHLKALDPGTLYEPRYVGRKRMPTSVIGLLVHIAEHTQRHLGQAINTAKWVLSQRR